MILHSLTATFGCLNHTSLELKAGLNVIQAPNESGKSTWLAFLRTMLYGLPTRERGALADKNRYAPWNGAAMQGRIDLTADDRDLVLIRDTVQGGAPMGRFYAAYEGTSTQVEGLTAQNAGEALTGVPRAVFERSACIRQSGLAIDQDAELEKRITSLISSGEESTSYSETEKRLRSALNQRRHNKTGSLPRAEAEIAEVREKLTQLHSLQQQSAEDQISLREAEAVLASANEKLALHDRMDVIQARLDLLSAEEELAQAETTVEQLHSEIEAEHLPSSEKLMHIKFNAANLLTTQVSMNHVQAQVTEAKKHTAAAQAEVDANLFAPAEPEEAAKKARADIEEYDILMERDIPSVPLIGLLTVLSVAGLAAAAYFWQLPYAICAGAALVPILLGVLRSQLRKSAMAKAAALLVPYGVTDPDEVEPMLIHYNNIHTALMAQKDAEAQINASWQNFFENCKRLSSEILEDTSSFCPDIENIHEVSPLLDAGIRKWKQLQGVEARIGQLRERCAVLEKQVADTRPLSEEELHLERPAESREALQNRVLETTADLQDIRSRIDRSSGEMAAIGDPIELAARLEALESDRDAAQEEYDAIALAMQAMDAANTELQKRFSPGLGRRAGEIFSALTGGRYEHVLLDENLDASAEDSSAVPREAGLLSQGAADQLYLAVRLAICQLVLPEEKAVPLILDDSLTNFDDDRMALALDWLLEESKKRQILLFTCQSREAVYLQNHKNVHIISL